MCGEHAYLQGRQPPDQPEVFVYLLPGIEVHAGQLAKVGLGDVDVKGLALVNEGTSVCHHVYECPLGELPHCLIQTLHLLRNAFNSLCVT